MRGLPSVSRELPFLEMDCEELKPSPQRIAEDWGRLILEDDRQAGTNTMMELGGLGSRHIYLQLLYTRWYDRMTRMGVFGNRGSEEDRQMLEELRTLVPSDRAGQCGVL